MKAVMISVSPKMCEKVASGDCTILVRKTRPKIDIPFKCYIYCPYGNMKDNYCLSKRGKVIGEFVCDGIYGIFDFLPYDADDIHHSILPYVLEQTCLQDYEIDEYLGAKDGYGWHISDLVIYDKPRAVGEFYRECKGICVDTAKKILCLKTNTLKSFGCDRKLQLTKPPQSWQYVEEKE